MNINKAVMTYRQDKTRKLGSLDCSTTEHSTLQQDDRTAHTFVDSHNCTARSEYTDTPKNTHTVERVATYTYKLKSSDEGYGKMTTVYFNMSSPDQSINQSINQSFSIKC